MPVVRKKPSSAQRVQISENEEVIEDDGPIKGKRILKRSNKVEVSLATEFSEPLASFTMYSFCIYGEKKVGKSSLAARFPRAHVLFTEPGGKALRLKAKVVNDWIEFKAYVDLFEKDTEFDTVVIDIVDPLYEMCFDYICKKNLVSHPNKAEDYGDTWKQIASEWRDELTRLMNCKGVVFLSHATEKEQEDREGSVVTRVVPTMSKGCAAFVAGAVDTIAYYGYEGYDRRLWIRGNQLLDAGTRLEEQFLTTEGEAIHSIFMGVNAQEAYDNLVSAFDNELEDPGYSPDFVPKVGIKAAPRKSKRRG